MASLTELKAKLPEISEVIMQADGFGLWLVWGDELNSVIIQTLEDYGGVLVTEEGSQALWFFFTPDIFLAAARLSAWARFNRLAVVMHIFSVRFKVGISGDRTLVVDEGLSQISVPPPDQFQVWIHSSASPYVASIPGISLAKQDGDVTSEPWASMNADARLPYQSSLAWYAILHPVGNPVDKAFQSGWREFFNHVEAVLQRNKFRFTLHNFYLMFPLDSLRQVRAWCRDFLTLINRLKVEMPQHYWPCVLAVVDRKGLNFNEELPQKINVDWDQLSPDFPHMMMRNALMLGKDFCVHEVRFAASQQSQEDWSSVTLCADDDASGFLPQLVPALLILGNHSHCFYCGQRSHETVACPTRHMPPRQLDTWVQMARLNLSNMRQAVKDIDARLHSTPDLRPQDLAEEESHAGLLTRAFYDLTWPAQVRSISTFWRMRSKDMSKAQSDLAPEDNSPLWDSLASFPDKDGSELEKELQVLAHRFPKDFRVMSLRGFVALEKGDLAKAISFWKEAEVFSTFPVIQAWHLFLQGRALEFQGFLTQAIDLYEQCQRMCPSWRLLDHRILVCDVKRGFSEQVLSKLVRLVEKDAHYFNRILIDPEMERGHIQVFSCLFSLWEAMQRQAKEEEKNLARTRDDLGNWFLPGNAFAEVAAERIHKILQLASLDNYVAFQSLAHGRKALEQDIQGYVQQEGKEFKSQFTSFIDRLKYIYDEAAWFPFPGILKDFNKNYNQSVQNLGWAMRANFQVAESFKKAQMLVDEENERINRLESRMRFLRVIRDSTLFMLSLSETFFWIEFGGIILVFALLPLVLFYGDKVGLDLTTSVLAKQQWQVQKALFFAITIVALGIAGLKTVLSFERIRDKVFAKAKAVQTGSVKTDRQARGKPSTQKEGKK